MITWNEYKNNSSRLIKQSKKSKRILLRKRGLVKWNPTPALSSLYWLFDYFRNENGVTRMILQLISYKWHDFIWFTFRNTSSWKNVCVLHYKTCQFIFPFTEKKNTCRCRVFSGKVPMTSLASFRKYRTYVGPREFLLNLTQTWD